MNVEEYNKKHSSDYALAGLGKRTLAFFLDLLIVVVVAWVLNANVTSTFMFNALGANEITNEQSLENASYVVFPIIFFGCNVRSETVRTPVTVDCIAPTMARFMRIRAPNACATAPLSAVR